MSSRFCPVLRIRRYAMAADNKKFQKITFAAGGIFARILHMICLRRGRNTICPLRCAGVEMPERTLPPQTLLSTA